MDWKQTKLLNDHYHALSDQARLYWQQGQFQQAAQLYQHESDTRVVVSNIYQQAGMPDRGNHDKAIVYSASLAMMAKIESKNKES